MQAAALEEQHVVLSIEHSWISYLPEILNPVEAILEGSEIPDLFGDDLESIAKPLKNAAQQDGYQESLTAYFWSRMYTYIFQRIRPNVAYGLLSFTEVKNKLHIVVTLESTSNTIEDLFTKYPALYRSSELLWLSNSSDVFSEKSSESLIKLMSKNQKDVPIPKYVFSVGIEQSIWINSPLRFKNLMMSYFHLHNEMLAKIQSQQQILQVNKY